MNLYQEISKIFGISTTKKTFETTLRNLDKSGGVTPRVMLDLISMLIRYVDTEKDVKLR